MSSPIWTHAAPFSELRPYEGLCWRSVEAQHHVATLGLVDTLEEQDLLEQLIERTKPSVPFECEHLDFLLSTPFRYGAPYPQGSRFRRAGRTQGVFYASERVATAVAEIAFSRLMFFADSPGTPWPSNPAEYTVFSVSVATAAAVDLTEPPLSAGRAAWMDKTDYRSCQRLADDARSVGAQMIRYQSVRDRHGGINLALLSCAAFSAHAPLQRQTWRIRLSAHGVQALCEFPRSGLDFDRAAFAGDPRIATMRWNR